MLLLITISSTFARENPGEAIPRNVYRVVNKKYVGYTYRKWNIGAEKTYPSKVATTLSFSETRQSYVSFSYSINFSSTIENSAIKKGISGSVGLQTGKAYSYTASYSVHVPAGKRARIEYRRAYKTYSGTLQREYTTDYNRSIWINVRTVYFREPSHLDFRDKVY